MKWIYNLLGSLLSFFDRITGSYALALLFYALIFKIVFLPFSIKQQKNQIAMAKLTPKIELIKAKYRGRTDQRTMQKQQQEIMELQQKEGYSPMAGCLPLLLQLPLIMLLYAVIQNPLSYIAKTSSVINDYNDGIASDSYTVEDIPESIRDYYGDIVVKYDENGTAVLTRKEITKADVVAVVWKDLNDSDYDSSKRLEISLINAIYNTVESDGGYVDTLHAMGLDYDTIPNFKFLGVNLADQPSMQKLNVLTLIPFLAAVASWFSMWLTRKINNTGLNATPDGQTKSSMLIMDLMMPMMTLFIAFSFSGMLGIYWAHGSMPYISVPPSFVVSSFAVQYCAHPSSGIGQGGALFSFSLLRQLFCSVFLQSRKSTNIHDVRFLGCHLLHLSRSGSQVLISYSVVFVL